MTVRTAYPALETSGDTLTVANFNRLPGGWIGRARSSADETGVTSITDLGGLSVAVTVNTSRQISVEGFVHRISSTVANDVGGLYVYEDGVQVGIAYVVLGPTVGASNGGSFGRVSVLLEPSAGAHTYKLRGARIDGSGSLAFRTPSHIFVVDEGPSS